MRRFALVLAVVLAVGMDADADDATTRHLLSGVRAFREQRYEDALVELKVVAKSPDAPSDLAFYLGPTLYKLGRYREALDVFVMSPAARDPLTDFYLGETYYQLRLFRKARTVFAGLRSRGLGPTLDAAAARYVSAVDAAFVNAPSDATIDYYTDSGLELIVTDAVAAGETLDEARQVEALAPAHHRHGEIAAALGSAWNTANRPALVIDALAADKDLEPEATYQLARAYATTGDSAHARPLLQTLAAAKGTRAGEAATLLSTLAP